MSEDYFETLKKQKIADFKDQIDTEKFLIKEKQAKTVSRDLPWYLKKAFESRDVNRIEFCLKKALGEGWTPEEINRSILALNTSFEN